MQQELALREHTEALEMELLSPFAAQPLVFAYCVNFTSLIYFPSNSNQTL